MEENRTFRFSRRRFCGALGMSLWTFLPRLAEAQSGSAPGGTLRVGVSPAFPPMVFKQGKELAGVEVDLARAFGTDTGRTINFVELPWTDQIDALNEGKIDIIMSSMSITPARKFMVNFSQPYFAVSQIALVRRESVHQYALGFPRNPSGTVGALKGTTGEFLVQREFPKAGWKAFTSVDEAAKALMKSKINLFIADSPIVWHLAGKYASDGLAVVPIALSDEQLAWATRKGDEELLAAANKFLSQALRDGSLVKIMRRWTAMGD